MKTTREFSADAGQRDLATVSRTILSELAPLVPMQHGVIYFNEATEGGEPDLRLLASYAYTDGDALRTRFRAGEGLIGQAAVEKEAILLTDVPVNYVQISSGLGARHRPTLRVPVMFEASSRRHRAASFYRFQTPLLPRPAHRSSGCAQHHTAHRTRER